jgi:hypothetical protein
LHLDIQVGQHRVSAVALAQSLNFNGSIHRREFYRT